jgi:serine/threonine-protein kinase RsbW/stage II sporulation protein AB (anti-sigma F factor)
LEGLVSGYFVNVAVANGEQTHLQLSLPAESLSIGRARNAVAEFAQEHGANRDDVALAVSEAVSNSVIHAFRGRTAGTVDVDARADGDALVVTIADDGVGVMPNPDSPGLGLGLALIGSLADGMELHRDGKGTTVVMRFSLTGQ